MNDTSEQFDQVSGGGIWPRVGVEIELMAPVGRSRKDLAVAIASDFGGETHRIFYPQSEYINLNEDPIFENLTLGFEARGRDGALLASCVDDLTLIEDLDRDAGPKPDWYRILSDDKRLLSLVDENCDPSASLLEVLTPLAKLFNVEAEIPDDSEYVKISDKHGASIAMSAPLPGERHRPCELITPPLGADRDEMLRRYLSLADELEFFVPVEAATHIHFDGAALENARVLANVIALFGHYRTALRQLVGTNAKCTRLGDWPKKVYRVINEKDYADLEWSDVVERLRQASPMKFCDFNFVNLLGDRQDKRTFEVRILPGTKDAEFIIKSIRLFEAMLHSCLDGQFNSGERFPKFDAFLAGLKLQPDDLYYWSGHAAKRVRRSPFGF